MLQEPVTLVLNNGLLVEIRSPRIDEASLVLAAMIEIADASPYILSTSEDFKKRTNEAHAKWIEDCNHGDSAVIIASFFEGNVVGLCDGRSFKDAKRRHRASLGLSIQKEFRSSGLGRQMTEFLLKKMKQFNGIKIIELDVMSANIPAIKLYQSLGFQTAGSFPGAYILPSGEELDNISMFLNI